MKGRHDQSSLFVEQVCRKKKEEEKKKHAWLSLKRQSYYLATMCLGFYLWWILALGQA